MTNKILFDTSFTTGTIPEQTVNLDLGEMAVNLADKKIFIRDGTGSPLTIADRIEDHSDSLAYAQGDLVIRGTQFLQCKADIGIKPFDAADWNVISPPGDEGSAAILKSPPTDDHNSIDLSGRPLGFGLEIIPDNSQSVPIFVAGGIGPDTGRRARIDPFGVPNAGLSGNTRRINQVGHPFSSRGQPVALGAGGYALADAGSNSQIMVGIVEEVLDTNSFILRMSGYTSDLQEASFPGGIITPWSKYYVGDTPGSLSLMPSSTGRNIPVLLTQSGTTAVVMVYPEAFVATSGDTMTGGLEFGTQPVTDELDNSQHIALFGTTTGINVSGSVQQVNIFSDAGAGVVKLHGQVRVTVGIRIDSAYPYVQLIDNEEGTDLKEWRIDCAGGVFRALPRDDEGGSLGDGLSLHRDETGMTDARLNLPDGPPPTLDSIITHQRLIDTIYPVGIVIESTKSTNPGTYIPGTTWEAFAPGRVKVGVGQVTSGYYWNNGTIRGQDTKTLLWSNMPAHAHSVDPPAQTFYTSYAGRTDNRAQIRGGEGNDLMVISTGGNFSSSWTGATDARYFNTSSDGGGKQTRWLTLNDYHRHSVSVNISSFTSGTAGSGTAFAFHQPSIGVYMWTRTA